MGQALLPEAHAATMGDAAAEDWVHDDLTDYCWRCGATAAYEAVTETGCGGCRRRKMPWDRVIRLSAYDRPVSNWIVSCKFHGGWSWSPWFGQRLAEAVLEADLSVDLVVPVPLHWRRRWMRGYDQAGLMAQSAARRLQRPFAALLSRIRATRPQSATSAVADRMSDLRQAFHVCRADLTNCNILLVDDVCTSGATAARCATALRFAGAQRIVLGVVAVAGTRTALPKRLSGGTGSLK